MAHLALQTTALPFQPRGIALHAKLANLVCIAMASSGDMTTNQRHEGSDQEGTQWQNRTRQHKTSSVVETTINHPFGNCLHHLFMVILGMVHCCFNHVTQYQWIGLRENLQETIVFDHQIEGFR